MKFLKAMVLGAAMFLFAASPAVAAGSTATTSAVKARALCHVYVGIGGFDVRTKPRHCDFYSALATPDTPSRRAVIPTTQVRWNKWGRYRASGRGKYHVSSVGWVRAKIRLSRPRVACGRLMFSRLRLRVRIPGEGWRPWGRRVPIRGCAPY